MEKMVRCYPPSKNLFKMGGFRRYTAFIDIINPPKSSNLGASITSIAKSLSNQAIPQSTVGGIRTEWERFGIVGNYEM